MREENENLTVRWYKDFMAAQNYCLGSFYVQRFDYGFTDEDGARGLTSTRLESRQLLTNITPPWVDLKYQHHARDHLKYWTISHYTNYTVSYKCNTYEDYFHFESCIPAPALAIKRGIASFAKVCRSIHTIGANFQIAYACVHFSIYINGRGQGGINSTEKHHLIPKNRFESRVKEKSLSMILLMREQVKIKFLV